MCIPSIEARSTERGYESIVKYCFFIVLVLIDTWWNVNKALSCLPTDIRSVLIDTWWNVNYVLFATLTKGLEVLIDTWWNVNVDVQIREVKSRRF